MKLFLIVWVLLMPGAAWPGVIILGSVHGDAAGEIKRLLPLAGYLGRRLQSEGISQGKVVVAKSVSQMATYMREGKVDLYIDSPFPSLAVSRLSGSRFLLRRWKKGVAEYHSVIFVKKDSDLRRLEDLKGKTLAFERPSSSSGYFFPKIALLQEGLKLVPKTEPTEPVGPEEVGYVFSFSDENIMVWVLRGKVIAGSTDNERYREQARQRLDGLQIIYRTFSFPRHIVSHRADLPADVVAGVKEVLIKMDQSEEGRKVLREFERTTKFDELPGAASSQLLETRRFVDVEIGLR